MPSTAPPAGLPPVHHVGIDAPLRWLAAGWRDFARAPLAGLAHGAAVAAWGWIVLALAHPAWWLAPGAFSGFVVLGPILATGLYEISRLLARGERPGLRDAVAAWRRGTAPLVRLGLVLAAAGSAWVLLSAALFALFVGTPLATPLDFVRYAAVGQGDWLFALWAVAGGLLAAVVFAATVVSPPLLLGRVIGLKAALLTSVRAAGDNPAPLALWAALIMLATALSLATAMLGFLVTIPVIGHASWHAYRDLVDASALPLRNA
jgi:uncharacterized membrane protein